MISKDIFNAHALKVARHNYPHVPWEMRYNENQGTLELWAALSKVPRELIELRTPASGHPWQDTRCVSWAVWVLCEKDFGEARLATLMTQLAWDLGNMYDIAASNRVIRRRKDEKRLEEWREHFAILAAVAAGLGRRR